MNRPMRLLGLLVAFLFLAAACSSDEDTAAGEDGATDAATTEAAATDAGETGADDDASAGEGDASTDAGTAGDGGFPVTVDTAEGDVTIEARPTRIVSLSPTATEMLFALGAGEQVSAVDSYSTFPPEAPTTELSAFEPSLEAITAEEPDLLVLSNPVEDVQEGMAAIGVPVIVLGAATTLADTYDQIGALGMATGNVDGAADLNSRMQTQIDEIMTQLPGDGGGEPVRVYHELDDSFYSASSASFIGDLYTMLGYENIADAADPDGTGYPQLQVEQIVSADPTLIVITDGYDYGVDDVAARPGWDSLSAVENGDVVQVDADVASRWGPRVVELLRTIVDASRVPAGG